MTEKSQPTTQIENSISSGNTIDLAKKEFKLSANNIILTVNPASFPHLEDIIKYLQHFKSLNYLLVCNHDKPELHYHIYGQYTCTLKFDRRYLYGAHIEKCFGSPQQNIAYCKGEDVKHKVLGVQCNVVLEMGQVKERGGRRVRDIMNMTDEELLELDANLYNAAMKIRAAKKISVDNWHKDIKVYYIWGPSGIGKSMKAIEILKEHGVKEFTEVKHVGEFWNGIVGSELTGAVIYDDFRDNHMKASEFINFIDYNKHLMNYKGGYAKNMADLIIITSIQNPELIYRSVGDEPRKQWLRRMEIIELKNHTNQDNELDICAVDPFCEQEKNVEVKFVV